MPQTMIRIRITTAAMRSVCVKTPAPRSMPQVSAMTAASTGPTGTLDTRAEARPEPGAAREDEGDKE